MGDNTQLRKQLARKTKTHKTYDFFPSEDDEDGGLTDWPSTEKNKRVMKSDSAKKGVSSTRKSQTLKSKVKQVSAGDSKKSGSTSRKRTRYSDLFDDVETKFSCLERVDRVLTRLENELNRPFFLKCMLPSNVAHGFWLHLPKSFCSVHFPNQDVSITLVDEWGNEYKTTYLIDRHGLSGGWRGFAIAHRLLKADVLIFHLVAPCRLQVNIVRANDSNVVSAALCLMSMDASEVTKKKDKKKRKTTTVYVEPFLPGLSMSSENVKGNKVQDSNSCDGFKFNSDVVGDSEIPTHPRSEEAIHYSDPSFLHEHPCEGVVCT